MRFIRGQTRKSNKLTMLIKFLGLSHGFDLLESNIHDQNEPLGDELAMSRHINPIHLKFHIGSQTTMGTLIKDQALANHYIHQI